MLRPLALAFVVACTARTPAAAVAVAALSSSLPDCYNPASYGGVPGDGVVDRAAIQAAVDAAAAAPDGGTVCVGPGRWTLDRAPIGSYDRYAAISTHGHHVTIRGAGPETVLELVGDQGASTTVVISIDPGAEHTRIADLTIDTAAATNTDEQTHGVATGSVCAGAACSPIIDTTIDHVTFVHPRNTASRKGDCVRLLGNNDATRVIGVRIVGSNFEDCARSAIQIQRGVSNLAIASNTFRCKSCDQTIDGEATGGGWDDGIAIVGNVILDEPTVQGDAAIALVSTMRATIVGNTMNRGIALYRTSGTVVMGNAITALAATGDDGTIDAKNLCEGLAITGNAITRGGHAGPVIKLVPHSGVVCAGATVTGNTLVQGTVHHGIYMESVSRAVIAANQVTFPAPGATAYSGIYERAVLAAAPVTGVAITGNVISGAVTYAVTLDASPATFGAGVSVTNNIATNTVFGVRLNNNGFTSPPVVCGNSVGPAAYGGNAVSSGD